MDRERTLNNRMWMGGQEKKDKKKKHLSLEDEVK